MSRSLDIGASMALAVAIGLAATPAAAGAYVGNGLSEVKPDQWVKNPHPQPVQLLVEFQTNGSANPRATAFVKDTVVQMVKSSALFSDVGDQAVPTGTLLHVVINNVVTAQAKDDAKGKGFTTGLTLGLVGNTVMDQYDCTIDYVATPSADKLSKAAHHQIYVQVGLGAPEPPNATRFNTTREAVLVMVRQCTANPLNMLAAEPAFLGAGAPAAAPAPAATSVSATPGSTSAPAPEPAPVPAAPAPSPTAPAVIAPSQAPPA